MSSLKIDFTSISNSFYPFRTRFACFELNSSSMSQQSYQRPDTIQLVIIGAGETLKQPFQTLFSYFCAVNGARNFSAGFAFASSLELNLIKQSTQPASGGTTASATYWLFWLFSAARLVAQVLFSWSNCISAAETAMITVVHHTH